MITSFEVGAVFKIIDEASPALKKMLEQIRALNKAIASTRTELSAVMKSFGATLDPAIMQTREFAAQWGAVSKAALGARASIAAAARASVPSVPSGGGANNARNRVFGRSGSGFHVSSLGVPLPGGHARISGGNAALAGAGLTADAIYQAAELQKESFLAWWHSGMADTPGSQNKIRDLIQNATSATGYNFKEVGEASEEIFRLMKGVPGNGLDIAPELLRAGATESLIKGQSLQESVKSLVEMSHMMGIYDPEQLKAMAPIIGFLSTANPASLSQMGRSASYSVPTLSNALGINAASVLFENTAIARAGATGSKSGTWVEHAFDRALPPDPNTMSAASYSRRMYSMRAAGLVDEGGQSTVMSSDGKSIDVEKFLTTARQALEKLPIALRNSVEKSVFGEQGARGFELMTSPKVMQQTAELKKEMPDFVPKYNSFMDQYSDRSAIQGARTAYADFNNVLSDIGSIVLPGVTGALRDFDGVLKSLRAHLPGGEGGSAWNNIGKGAVEGAAMGAGTGFLVGGPFGALAGGGLGGLAGGTASWLNSIFELGESAKKTGSEAAVAAPEVGNLGSAIRALIHDLKGAAGGLSVPAAPAGGGKEGMIHNNITVDGTKLASVVTRYQVRRASLPTEGSAYYDNTRGAPASDFAWSTA
jgi:hypothetical protein